MEENQIENEQTLVEKLAEAEDKYVRLYAEFENYKRRVHKEKEEIKYGEFTLSFRIPESFEKKW
jgi:molecular chaperone GrpE (heat shock protein)